MIFFSEPRHPPSQCTRLSPVGDEFKSKIWQNCCKGQPNSEKYTASVSTWKLFVQHSVKKDNLLNKNLKSLKHWTCKILQYYLTDSVKKYCKTNQNSKTMALNYDKAFDEYHIMRGRIVHKKVWLFILTGQELSISH